MCITQTKYVTMKKINFYQRQDNGLLFTYTELDELKELTKNFMEQICDWNGYTIEHIVGITIPKIDSELSSDTIHIIKIGMFAEDYQPLCDLVNKYINTDVKIIIIGGNLEQNIFSIRGETEDIMFDKISKCNNIRVIHNAPLINTETAVFEPKIYFYDYINLQKEMSGDGITNFYYNKDVFSRLKKDKRIGFHMGTIGNGIGERYRLVKRFVTTDYISHPKMFLTINYKHQLVHHNRLLSETNYPLEKYMEHDSYFIERNSTLRYNPNKNVEHGYHPPNYFLGLSKLFINSDIDMVYETNTKEPSKAHRKPTEKILKNILLGKPFINTDPVMYHLVKEYGFKQYDCLLGPELLQMYNAGYFNKDTYIQVGNTMWLDLLFERIQQLLDMDETEYRKILDEANLIAKENIKHFEDVYYNTSIFGRIKELGWI